VIAFLCRTIRWLFSEAVIYCPACGRLNMVISDTAKGILAWRCRTCDHRQSWY